MFRIIGVVVNGSHCTQLVKTFNQHPFMIHVGESHRPVNFSHTLLSRPFFNSIEQTVYYFSVIDKVEESESGTLLVPHLITAAVDHSGNAADYLIVFVSQIIDSITDFKSRILFFI